MVCFIWKKKFRSLSLCIKYNYKANETKTNTNTHKKMSNNLVWANSPLLPLFSAIVPFCYFSIVLFSLQCVSSRFVSTFDWKKKNKKNLRCYHQQEEMSQNRQMHLSKKKLLSIIKYIWMSVFFSCKVYISLGISCLFVWPNQQINHASFAWHIYLWITLFHIKSKWWKM